VVMCPYESANRVLTLPVLSCGVGYTDVDAPAPGQWPQQQYSTAAMTTSYANRPYEQQQQYYAGGTGAGAGYYGGRGGYDTY
jgi:hypothetical protein